MSLWLCCVSGKTYKKVTLPTFWRVAETQFRSIQVTGICFSTLTGYTLTRGVLCAMRRPQSSRLSVQC